MLVALQLVGVATIPLNLTVLVPCVAPKFAPLIVTEVPTAPDVGFRLVMLAGEGFPPPPGFEYVEPLHPVFVMASAISSIDSAFRRNASPDVIVFIAKNILSVLRMHAQMIIARSGPHYRLGERPARRVPRRCTKFGNHSAWEKHRRARSGMQFRLNLSRCEGANSLDRA
jgi:hypothetical protein